MAVNKHQTNKKILRVIDGGSFEIPPVWMMRQAGRYLPEYLEIRKTAGSFLELCYSPKFAEEVTLQPIRRFGFDAAILFSDILVIPDAMGRKVRFEEGRGPILEPINITEIDRLETNGVVEHLSPVLETLDRLTKSLDTETTLLGFCGAPWTVATYMIAGHGTPDQAPARQFALSHPKAFKKLINKLVEASTNYLIAQLDAGADEVQIFDSWASVLDEDQFLQWCVDPVKRIVTRVKSARPDARIIGFPKGIGAYYHNYRALTGIDMLGLDWAMPMDFARELQKQGPIQGNLDPQRLISGGKSLDNGVDNILKNLSNGPLVFNLGHGITPQTPIAHVEQMLKRIRG